VFILLPNVRDQVSPLASGAILASARIVTEVPKAEIVSQFGEVVENLVFSHAGSEILQHVIDGIPHPADARLAAALIWLNSDEVFVLHGRMVSAFRQFGKESAGSAETPTDLKPSATAEGGAAPARRVCGEQEP